MSGFLEAIYQKAPIWLQNIMVSFKGWQFRRERLSGRFSHYLAQALQSQWLPEDELRMLQLHILQRLLQHAYETVPYYREAFDAEGVHPNDVQELSDLQVLPMLEKATLRENPKALISAAVPENQRRVIYTSGTTGTPLNIHYTPDERQQSYGLMFRQYEWGGYRLGMRRAKFGGRSVVPGNQKRPPFWRYDRVHNSLHFSSWHISPDTARDYVKALADFDVQFIEGYPSSIGPIACAALEEPRIQVRPLSVVTTAETLSDWQRQAISEAFDCPVLDQYGCTEMAVMVYQCPEGGYHEVCETGIAEFIRPEGAPDSAPAEIVATGLLNFTQPLIRYRIGDAGIPNGPPCSCGRGLPTIRSVIGRTEDVLVTPSGRLLTRLGVVKNVGGIRECQIVQDAQDHLLLRVVPAADYTEASGQYLIEQCRTRFGDEMRYEVEVVEEIERTSRGKFQAVVSKLDRPSLWEGLAPWQKGQAEREQEDQLDH